MYEREVVEMVDEVEIQLPLNAKVDFECIRTSKAIRATQYDADGSILKVKITNEVAPSALKKIGLVGLSIDLKWNLSNENAMYFKQKLGDDVWFLNHSSGMFVFICDIKNQNEVLAKIKKLLKISSEKKVPLQQEMSASVVALCEVANRIINQIPDLLILPEQRNLSRVLDECNTELSRLNCEPSTDYLIEEFMQHKLTFYEDYFALMAPLGVLEHETYEQKRTILKEVFSEVVKYIDVMLGDAKNKCLLEDIYGMDPFFKIISSLKDDIILYFPAVVSSQTEDDYRHRYTYITDATLSGSVDRAFPGSPSPA